MSLGHAEFLAQIQAADEEERPRLLLAFSLAQQPERIAAAINAAALPHWFDREFLNALLDIEALSEQEFDYLTTLSFVDPHPTRGWNIHERTRDLLLEQLWLEQPERYRELSRRAATYCESRDQQSTDWRVETIYHQLVGNPESGWIALANQGWDWQNPPHFAFDKVEVLAHAAREHRDAGRISGHGATWTTFWEAHLDKLYSRNREAKRKLLEISLDSDLNPYTRSACLRALGDVHLMLSEVTAARRRYEEALPLYRTIDARIGEANCLLALGHVHFRLSEVKAARGRYEEALPLYRTVGDRLGEANCLRALGDVHLSLSEVEAARGRYEEALSLYRTIGDRHGEANCLQALGNVHLSLSEVERGRKQIERALDIFLDIGGNIGQGNCLRLLGDCELANALFESAHDHYVRALAQFEKIGSREGVAECLESFARLYQAEGTEDKAAEAWSRCAEQYDELGMPLRAAKCRKHERSFNL